MTKEKPSLVRKSEDVPGYVISLLNLEEQWGVCLTLTLIKNLTKNPWGNLSGNSSLLFSRCSSEGWVIISTFSKLQNWRLYVAVYPQGKRWVETEKASCRFELILNHLRTRARHTSIRKYQRNVLCFELCWNRNKKWWCYLETWVLGSD